MTESSFRRLLLRFALAPVLCMVALLAILSVQLREITVRRAEVSNATAILLESNRLLTSMVDEETGIRGYLATHEPLFLQPYHEASARLGGELSALTVSVARNPIQMDEVRHLEASFKEFDAVNQVMLHDGPAKDQLASLTKQKQAMDRLRAEFGELMAEQVNVRAERRREIDSLFGSLPVFGVVLGFLVTIFLIGHGVYLFRQMTRAFRQQLNESVVQRDSLHTTLQSIGDAVIVCDHLGRITLMNPTAEQVTGWSQMQAHGQPLEKVFQIFNESTRLPVESPATKVLRVGRVVGLANHTLLLRRDGSEVAIDDSGGPIRNASNKIVGVVLVFRDITERKIAEDRLRESETRFNAIYGASHEYIGIITPEGVVIDCNRASLDFAHNTLADVAGKNFWETPWFLHTPGAAEKVRQAIVVAAQGSFLRQELDLIRPSGEIMTFDFSLAPVRDPAGKVIFLVPEARDITDLKRAEAALIQSEKLAVVGRLAASIAHEINNPLESVTNLIYLTRQLAILPEVRRYLDLADQEIRRVSNIVSQTLRFHRQSSRPQPTLCAELFSTVLSMYEGRLRNSRIAIEKRYRSRQPVVCFEGEIRQVLNNLVGNAIDAMPHGGRLLIRSRDATDWASGRKGIAITVADTGTGMSPETVRTIFDPFFTTKGLSGTGLGLWVSKEITDRHQGTLRIRTKQDAGSSGSVFSLFLPLHAIYGQPLAAETNHIPALS